MIVAFIFIRWIFDNIVFGPAHVDFITFQWLCDLGHFTGAEDALCVKSLPFKVQSRYVTGQFTMSLTASFVIGLIVAFPYVFWEVWSFIKPGLYRKEQSNSRGAVFAVSFLFMLGVMFGYFVMSPLAIWFMSTYSISDMIVNEFDITSYVSTIVALVFGSGLLFQMPIVFYFLTKVGLVTPQFMRKYRRHAIVSIVIIGAIVTPPDPLSQMLISLPLYLLYEVSIFISAIELRKKKKREEAELAAEQAGMS